MDNGLFGERLATRLWQGPMDGLVPAAYGEALLDESDAEEHVVERLVGDPDRTARVFTGVHKGLWMINRVYGKLCTPERIMRKADCCGHSHAILIAFVNAELPSGSPRCSVAEVKVAAAQLKPRILS